MSLHVLPLALEHSDRILGLRHGRMFVEGRTSSLTADDLAPVYDIEPEEGEE